MHLSYFYSSLSLTNTCRFSDKEKQNIYCRVISCNGVDSSRYCDMLHDKYTMSGLLIYRPEIVNAFLLFYSISYCNVASSRLVYYSILNYLGQRSQNISIKYPLINILKMLVLLTKTVYCSQLYGSYDSIKNVVTLIFFSSCFIKIVTFC